jgi:hypothetical protein
MLCLNCFGLIYVVLGERYLRKTIGHLGKKVNVYANKKGSGSSFPSWGLLAVWLNVPMFQSIVYICGKI